MKNFPPPFASLEAAQTWHLMEGFALVELPCVGCGDVWQLPMRPGEEIPGGYLCVECQDDGSTEKEKDKP